MEIKTSSFFWDSSISSHSLLRRRYEFSINPHNSYSSSMRTLHSLFVIPLDLVSSNPNVYDLQLEELRCYQLQQQQQEQLNISIFIFAYIYSCLKGEKMRKRKKKKWNAQGKNSFFRLHNMWLFSYFNIVTIFFLNLKIITVWQHIHDPATKAQLFKRSLASVIKTAF